jgi:phosphate/sulfate permease
MTINTAIALVNAVMGVAFVTLGGALLWQARRSLRQWPVSALVALAGPYIGAGIMLLHRMGWRLGDLPGDAFDRNGAGTLVVQVVITAVVLALGQRIARGRLLTASDRRRVDAP